MSKKYSDEVFQNLLDLVGGKDNIASLTHCVTRLRFVLKDESLADDEMVAKLPFSKGVNHAGGQYQIIIGPEVEDVYTDFLKVNNLNLANEASGLSTAAASEKKNLAQRMLMGLSEIFIPLLPAIIAAGILAGLKGLIMGVAINGSTIGAHSVFWAGAASIFALISTAVFTYLPVGIAWSTTRRFGTNPILGIVLGVVMTLPAPLLAAPNTPMIYTNFGFAKMPMIGYTEQVVPALLAALALVYLEKGLKKIIPTIVQQIFVPTLALLIAVILTFTVIGPVGRFLGNGIGSIVKAGLTGPAAIPMAVLFGCFYAPIVITGLHYAFPAVNLQLIASSKVTPLFPLVALSNVSQASAALGIALLTKDKREKEIAISAVVSGYLGVTEPAMYGVNLRYKFSFYCAMIGSGIACGIAAAFGTVSNAIGVGGIPAFLVILPKFWFAYLMAMVISGVITLILTMIIYKRKEFKGTLEVVELS